MARFVLRRGFTVFDLIAVLGVLGVAGVLLVGIMLPSIGGTRCGSTQLRDSTQVRGIHQAMVVWAQNNKDRYPLPSEIDVENTTVAEEGSAKDTTANILSMMVYNGSIGTEMLYSPAEANGSVSVLDTYEFDLPKAAVNPAKAFWDPALKAGLRPEEPGHISYAHLIPHGERLRKWNNSFNAEDVIVGNRGPQVASVQYGKRGEATPVYANYQSVTFLIHGSRAKWEGNVAFNDNHVEFLNEPKAGRYKLAGGSEREDVLFYDEPDDDAGVNKYMGMFTKAGAKREEFKAIWD
jgi:hypothetical protein